MRMKMVCDDRTLREIANEFLALKKAQKIRERTLSDYRKYINKFIEQSDNSLDVDVLKIEILDFFSEIPKTSPARFNHPYQYLHSLFAWCAKQDYIPYNPFDKLELKKVRDEGNVQPAEIKDIQKGVFCNYTNHDSYSQLGNSLAILCGAISGDSAAVLCEKILGDPDMTPVSLSMRCFLSDALIAVDKKRYTPIILEQIEKLYVPMLEFGSTTVWKTEIGQSDFDNAGSLCHGWSAIPIYYYHTLLA